MSELLPCPFCGGPAAHRVECCECFASSAYAESDEIAIRRWNTRAPTKKTSESGTYRLCPACGLNKVFTEANNAVNRCTECEKEMWEKFGKLNEPAPTPTGEGK